jgi:hypothetical protein
VISLGKRGAVPKEQRVNAIHIECDSEVQFELKILLSKIHALDKNDDHPNGIRMRLVPKMNSLMSPETRQNVTRLCNCQGNFQKQTFSAISWDIAALDFVDPVIGRLLRDVVMKIESCHFPRQQLFHVSDKNWNKKGVHFAFFPNVGSEAGAMMMARLPFLVHHCKDTATKWFSTSAQIRAQGAEWDPDKGCAKTLDNKAVSWMMTKAGFSTFDDAATADAATDSQPHPSNLQSALIDDQDSVGTFDPNASTNALASNGRPAVLITGAQTNPIPRSRILPSGADSVTALVGSKSSCSLLTGGLLTGSVTKFIFLKFTKMEGALAKVNRLNTMMEQIALKLEIVVAADATADTVPPSPSTIEPPKSVRIPGLPTPATLLNSISAISQAVSSPAFQPNYVRPSTHALVTGNWGVGSPTPGFWLGIVKFTYASHSHSLVGRPLYLDILPGIVGCYNYTSCFGPYA